MIEHLLFEQMLNFYVTQREADQQRCLRCQCGEHDLLTTASPGVVVCRTLGSASGAARRCRLEGVSSSAPSTSRRSGGRHGISERLRSEPPMQTKETPHES